MTVLLWQMPSGGADLVLDEIVVAEQPLSGGGDAPVGPNAHCQQLAGRIQDPFVVRQSRQKPVRRFSVDHGVRGRQHFAVLLHLLFAEKLRAQRGFASRGRCFPEAVAQTFSDLKQVHLPRTSTQSFTFSSEPLSRRATVTARHWRASFCCAS